METRNIYFLGAAGLGVVVALCQHWFGNLVSFAVGIVYLLAVRSIGTRYGRRHVTPKWKIDRAVQAARERAGKKQS